MNKINVNKAISIVKVIPVVLGVGVLTYELIGSGISMFQRKRSDSKIKDLSMELNKIIREAGCDDSNVTDIMTSLYAYTKEKDEEFIKAMLKTYKVPKDNRDFIIQFINTSLDIK